MKIPSRNTLGFIALLTGVPALALLILPYKLFPEWYIPKDNAAALGYIAPATIEGWIFMGAGLALLAVAVICVMLRKSRE